MAATDVFHLDMLPEERLTCQYRALINRQAQIIAYLTDTEF